MQRFAVACLILLLLGTHWSLHAEEPAESAEAEARTSETEESPREGGYFEGLPGRAKDSLLNVNELYQSDSPLVRSSQISWNRSLHSTLDLPDWAELAGMYRLRFESVSHPWRAGQSSATDQQLLTQARVRAGINHGPFAFLFEGQESRTYFDGPGAFAGGAVENRADVLQLYAALSSEDALSSGLRADLHVGRFSMDIGSKRLVGRNGYPNNTNNFQGFHAALGKSKNWRFRAFAVSPIARAVLERDQGSTERLFWGTVLESRSMPWLLVDAYYLGLSDRKSATAARFRELSTFGSRLYRKGAGTRALEEGAKHGVDLIDYDLEGMVQVGESRTRNLLAFVVHAGLGYTLPAPMRPRILAEFDYASGTSNPAGADSSTFDPLFSLRRPDLHTTSIFGPFRYSNIQSIGGRFQLHPLPMLLVQLRFRIWHLAEARDALAGTGIGVASLQDATGSAGDSLGETIELASVWALTPNIEMEAGYVRWFKGSYFRRLPAGAGLPNGGEDDTDYFFVQTSFRF